MPTADGAIICSNRDEKRQRAIAAPPQQYSRNGLELVYPKDPDAAGTWIIMQNSGQCAVLLNGAFQNHHPVYPYRKSRGLVLLDIAASRDMNKRFQEIDLDNIEPFTVILFKEGQLMVSRWDGQDKHQLSLDPTQSYIWSSATLYSAEIVRQRQDCFEEWLLQKISPTEEDLLDFHHFGGPVNAENGIRMNRNGALLTVSITSIHIRPGFASMQYYDLLRNQKHHQDLRFVREAHQIHT